MGKKDKFVWKPGDFEYTPPSKKAETNAQNISRRIVARQLRKQAGTSIHVNMSKYREALTERLLELARFSWSEEMRRMETRYDPDDIARSVEKLLGPGTGTAVRRKDKAGILATAKALLARSDKLMKADVYDADAVDANSKVVHKLWDFEDALTVEERGGARDLAHHEAEAEKDGKHIFGETMKIVQAVEGEVRAAIARIPTFTTTKVEIEPRANSEYITDPATTLSVTVGTKGADFTVFTGAGGKIDNIDDVLEGGDRDFFHSPEEADDYFKLVNELRNPGSTSRGKRVVLWTARPTKDRSRYEGARTVPPNIFLSTSMDDAAGLADDLGASETRDLWRVVMDSRYLVETLNAGSLRHYQTVGREPVPVEKITLYAEGGSSRTASEDQDKARVAREKQETAGKQRIKLHRLMKKGEALKLEEVQAVGKNILTLLKDGYNIVAEGWKVFGAYERDALRKRLFDTLHSIYQFEKLVEDPNTDWKAIDWYKTGLSEPFPVKYASALSYYSDPAITNLRASISIWQSGLARMGWLPTGVDGGTRSS